MSLELTLGLAAAVAAVGLIAVLGGALAFDIGAFSLCALVNVNVPGLDPIDIAAPLMVVLGVMFGYLTIRDLYVPPVVAGLWFLFVLLYAVSNTVNEPELILVAHFVANMCLWCFLKMFVISRRRLAIVLGGLLVGAVVCGGLGVASAVGLWSPGDLCFAPFRWGRFQALLGDPNIAALLSSVLAVWVLEEILHPALWLGGRVAKLVLLGLAVVQVAASLSRSGWGNLGLSVLVWGVLDAVYGGARRIIVAVVAVGVIGVAAATVLNYAGLLESIGERAETFTQHSRVEEGRFALRYTASAAVLGLESVFGVGTGRAKRFTADIRGTQVGAHNAFVQVLGENGWPAFVVLVAVLAVFLGAMIREYRRRTVRWGLSMRMLLAGLVGLGFSGMFHDLMSWPQAWVLPSLASAAVWVRPDRLAQLRRPAESLAGDVRRSRVSGAPVRRAALCELG